MQSSSALKDFGDPSGVRKLQDAVAVEKDKAVRQEMGSLRGWDILSRHR
jgi:hypothetical protein